MKLTLDDSARELLAKKKNLTEVTIQVFEACNTWAPLRESVITYDEPKDNRDYVVRVDDGINFHIELIIWERNEEIRITRKGFLGVRYLELVDAKM